MLAHLKTVLGLICLLQIENSEICGGRINCFWRWQYPPPLTPPSHYLWHFPPQRDRKYNRAVTKAPSAGQYGHFCGITKNDKQSEKERGTDTYIKHMGASAHEKVPLSQRILPLFSESVFLKVYFSKEELTVPKPWSDLWVRMSLNYWETLLRLKWCDSGRWR